MPTRGFIEVIPEHFERFRATHGAFGLAFNPDEPDVFFYQKTDCDFKPKYGQPVSFSLKLRDKGGHTFQAQDMRPRYE